MMKKGDRLGNADISGTTVQDDRAKRLNDVENNVESTMFMTHAPVFIQEYDANSSLTK